MKFWSDGHKLLLLTVALASAVALVTTAIYGFTAQMQTGESSLVQASRTQVPSLKQRIEWAKEAAMRAQHPALPKKMSWTARKSPVSHRTARRQQSIQGLETENADLKRELALAGKAHRSQGLTALKAENSHLKAEIRDLEAKNLESQNEKLQHELHSLRASGSRGNGRISALATTSFPLFSNRNQQQALAWLGPSPKYADKPPGFNPLSEVTRAEKWKDPDYRLPLKAPEPSAGDLSEQVTGDYASYNTYANLVDNKENILWCTQEFDYLPSRIECIRRLVPAGPFLA